MGRGSSAFSDAQGAWPPAAMILFLHYFLSYQIQSPASQTKPASVRKPPTFVYRKTGRLSPTGQIGNRSGKFSELVESKANWLMIVTGKNHSLLRFDSQFFANSKKLEIRKEK